MTVSTSPTYWVVCAMYGQCVEMLGDMSILLFTLPYVMPHFPMLGWCEASWAVYNKMHISPNICKYWMVCAISGWCVPCPEYERAAACFPKGDVLPGL